MKTKSPPSAYELMVQAHRQAIRDAGFSVTPYRVGRRMGEAHHRIFWAWSDQARKARDYSGRPEEPACPYTNPISVSGWKEGFRREAIKPRP